MTNKELMLKGLKNTMIKSKEDMEKEFNETAERFSKNAVRLIVEDLSKDEEDLLLVEGISAEIQGAIISATIKALEKEIDKLNAFIKYEIDEKEVEEEADEEELAEVLRAICDLVNKEK